MFNPFSNRSFDISGPARDYAPVTPDDAADLPQVAVALYVETGGIVRFTSESGQVREVETSDYGWILCGVRRVHLTGTTASGIHAMTVG